MNGLALNRETLGRRSGARQHLQMAAIHSSPPYPQRCQPQMTPPNTLQRPASQGNDEPGPDAATEHKDGRGAARAPASVIRAVPLPRTARRHRCVETTTITQDAELASSLARRTLLTTQKGCWAGWEVSFDPRTGRPKPLRRCVCRRRTKGVGPVAARVGDFCGG